MASTFHLGAYHELADTFTLGFQKKKKEKKRNRKKKQAEFLSFAVNFLLPPPPHRRRDVTRLRSLPQMDGVYINSLPVQAAFY